ncbi:LPXTG cell wall anchor domain-containing protein [Limosilactobacillus sp.]
MQLPQTGHHESLSTILLGLATGMIAAILPIKKWR